MDSMEWTQVLIQLPLVGVFIYYSLEIQKRYEESLRNRDKAYLDALERIANRLDAQTIRLEELSSMTTAAIGKTIGD